MPRSVKTSLLRSYRKLLRPLIRILVRNDVTLGEFQLTVADAYMEEVIRALPISDSYIDEQALAARIGLDVKVLRDLLAHRATEDPKGVEFERQSVSRVLDAWHSEPGYSGVYGITYDITEAEFRELCKIAAPGLEHKRIATLMAAGGCLAIERNDSNELEYRCISNIYKPEPLSDPQIDLVAERVSNLVSTLDTNLHSTKPTARRFEAHVWTADGLSDDQLDEFDQRIRERFQEVLDSIDAWFTSQAHKRKRLFAEGEKMNVTGVNVFHYVRTTEEKDFRAVLTEKGIDSSRNE